MPFEQQQPIRNILYKKVKQIFIDKKGLNFSCELYLFEK
jgi:hypothetical protein